MRTFLRETYCREVERIAEPWALEHVRPTFGGDAESAFSLCAALGNCSRGVVAVALWTAKVPKPAFRAYLASAWDHDHRHVIEAVGTRRRLAAMFRYATFPKPEGAQHTVRVWRGTSAMTLAQSRAGYSWTVDRDVACWFAMRFAEKNGRPLVVVAEVVRAHIALFHNEREEHEVVLMRSPAGARIDGEADDWRHRFELHNERIRGR